MTAKPKLLIVDDEVNTREALARYLKLRFQVSTAEDGGIAIERLREEDFDVVLTDLRMPNADGMSVLDAARSKACRPACILLTAYGSISDAVAAVKKGAFDFVPKPVKLDKLEAVIAAALKSRSDTAAGGEKKPLPETPGQKEEPAAATSSPSGRLDPGFLPPQGKHNPMTQVVALAEKVAPTRTTVLLTGESGTGKEVIARLIHDRSGRTGYFIPVHCAALTETLIESELFGAEKGAYTGAERQRKGRFELADKGTLFLDEIGEIDLPTQVKLLRVLETRSFERVGGSETVKVDVRLIAATNRDLRQMVADGTFREDLFYRLSVVNLALPPLRERVEEIAPLAQRFAAEFARDNNMPEPQIDPAVLNVFAAYPWPGNIRELRNSLECMTALSSGNTLTLDLVPANIRQGTPLIPSSAGTQSADVPASAAPSTLEDAEWRLIETTLAECGNNRTEAARRLGISRRTLHRRLAEHGKGEREEA